MNIFHGFCRDFQSWSIWFSPRADVELGEGEEEEEEEEDGEEEA